MINNFIKKCAQSKLSSICDELLDTSKQAMTVNNGNIAKWESAIDELKTHNKGRVNYQPPYLNIEILNSDTKLTQQSLKKLTPWRKGPYQIGGLKLDSEWRGDMKWDRLKNHIQPLKGKTVLDVGSGNGYFTYLMALSGAQIALGIEPFLLFNYQFMSIHTLINNPPSAFVLPLKLEQMPKEAVFDTVFSMGVLYHQKDPLLHLQQLKTLLIDEGELILETLIIDKKHGKQIIPKDRYARMRNVWCLPSTDTIHTWLKKVGFKNIKLLDTTKTTPQEQRSTHWIGDNTQSIKDFLDPNNDDLTVEGLPAPLRAIFTCQK
ncbi:tRNA 5-methoxyuridine(34)/uridine 5-oxyacetic acid(34) synthase CmoB [bacterium endosymbiont of Bathymodiolus sp. 5 South]|jgi:tRNA (mo5U34)-methyltransferase|uniref:tRNA 5-methoxyuridine(34)/uridine 5-oxyacetic acid(34) synthase CmoB n=1 Tax=bacterium endosymbiont of Bathymodiolus sp. 5 South TaxID=1181670 RepID=UPI0010B8757A|nr:tRNA 5-methoxyuridine(34)/uridine 5-oxyacetic acid(34) synthase CmoB [bacterium endosymbiont of Bathymodiolus sp. 5 South]CAC9650123.1 tRNA (mo5U34)-methyltransferase [uncultured Gammaproteobacteria bacterium]SHN90622.1 tRNA (5-methoxyuridine) 34 synthase [bacterium endosymbiont of Bathymodiolus sp. 5 South]VVH55281.1 tRNA (5-methoxyuridine) 34 synthase [uncultured Gammaproteobacteria bacterium]VVH63625.1 tRNA (5-methoxyuridine) 34 synthase [uncultured Gammaproteobacteria bacterium]VVM21171